MARAGLNGVRLEKASGVDNSLISRLRTGKRGKRATADVVAKLARALDVSDAWLARGAEPMERATEPMFQAQLHAEHHGLPPNAQKALNDFVWDDIPRAEYFRAEAWMAEQYAADGRDPSANRWTADIRHLLATPNVSGMSPKLLPAGKPREFASGEIVSSGAKSKR